LERPKANKVRLTHDEAAVTCTNGLDACQVRACPFRTMGFGYSRLSAYPRPEVPK